MSDVVYYVRDGLLIKEVDTDGISFLKNGSSPRITVLCPIQEAISKYPKEYARAVYQNASSL
jgi:hypothetical protein